ncbi:MAG: pilin [Patescibacteria group bacterium]
MSIKYSYKICLLTLLAMMLISPLIGCLAGEEVDLNATVVDSLRNSAGVKGAGYNTEATEEGTNGNIIVIYLGRIIKYALTFLGVIFFLFMIYGGIRWMVAQGNEEQVTEAKKMIKSSVIGLVIILSAGIVAWVVFEYLFKATTGQSS